MALRDQTAWQTRAPLPWRTRPPVPGKREAWLRNAAAATTANEIEFIIASEGFLPIAFVVGLRVGLCPHILRVANVGLLDELRVGHRIVELAVHEV